MAHPIFTTIKEHWHKQVRESAATAFRTMTKIAPKLAHEATNGPHKDVTNEKQGDLKKWVSIARTAARFDHQINLAKKLSEITSLYNSSQKNFEQMRLPSSTRPKKYGLLL